MKRQRPNGIDEKVFDEAIETLTNAIGKDWLDKGDDKHPLRRLWRREDKLASNELFSIGFAIQALQIVDSSWTRDQVKLLRSAEKNNYTGASAELLSAYMLNNVAHPIIPAKSNQAGFDATLNVSDSKKVRISIKSYGMSKHEEYFNRQAQQTEELIKKYLKKYKYYPVTIWIDCPAEYPSPEKWKILHDNLDQAFAIQKNAKEPFFGIVRDKIPEWTVIVTPHIKSAKHLHPAFNSYTLVMSCVYHKNENENLLSKIQDACANLTKHSAIETDVQKNFLLIHLSPLASVRRCQEWLDEYFAEFPNKPISGVLFHQPAVATELADNSTSITHFFKPYFHDNKIVEWLPPGFQFQLTFPAGRYVNHASTNTMIFEYHDGRQERLTVDERYFYQRGNHYVQMQPDGKGGFTGNINLVAAGVFSHVVIEIPNQPGSAVINGKFPPSDELLLI